MQHSNIETYHRFLQGEYSDMANEGINALKADGIIAPTIPVFEDPRKSFSLFYPLPESAQQAIEKQLLIPLNNLFKEINAPQVVFGPDWLHVSHLVIQRPEVEPPFDSETTDTQPYKDIISQVLKEHHPFNVSFRRLMAFGGNPGGISLGGFPDTIEIDKVRQDLRDLMDERGLKRFERRPLEIFHTTITRWDSQIDPENATKLVDFLEQMDGREFWTGTLDTLHLVTQSYNLSPQNTHIFERYHLS